MGSLRLREQDMASMYQDRTDPASPIVLSPHTAAASVTVLSRETGCCFTGIKM